MEGNVCRGRIHRNDSWPMLEDYAICCGDRSTEKEEDEDDGDTTMLPTKIIITEEEEEEKGIVPCT